MPYFLVIALQIFCIYHVLKNQQEWWWILLIIFVPVLGSIFYIFTKVLNQKKVGQEFTAVQNDLSSIFNPGGKIKELEKQVEFSDTFVNKVALADAYLVNQHFDQAIEVFQSTRKGVHENDVHVNHQLINAYFHKEDYQQVIEVAKRAKENKAFGKSNARVLYALTLEKTRQIDDAESILQSMNGMYSDLEPRIILGQFLTRQDKKEVAKSLFQEIIEEGEHMDNLELKAKRQWIQQARQELKRLK